jgi:hypothetical protein
MLLNLLFVLFVIVAVIVIADNATKIAVDIVIGAVAVLAMPAVMPAVIMAAVVAAMTFVIVIAVNTARQALVVVAIVIALAGSVTADVVVVKIVKPIDNDVNTNVLPTGLVVIGQYLIYEYLRNNGCPSYEARGLASLVNVDIVDFFGGFDPSEKAII